MPFIASSTSTRPSFALTFPVQTILAPTKPVTQISLPTVVMSKTTTPSTPERLAAITSPTGRSHGTTSTLSKTDTYACLPCGRWNKTSLGNKPKTLLFLKSFLCSLFSATELTLSPIEITVSPVLTGIVSCARSTRSPTLPPASAASPMRKLTRWKIPISPILAVSIGTTVTVKTTQVRTSTVRESSVRLS